VTYGKSWRRKLRKGRNPLKYGNCERLRKEIEAHTITIGPKLLLYSRGTSHNREAEATKMEILKHSMREINCQGEPSV